MKNNILLTLGLVFALSGSLASVHAQSVTTSNVFSGMLVTVDTANYGVATGATDGTTVFVVPGFDGAGNPSLINISGFNSSIDSIQIYSAFPNALRYSPGVTIWYSLSNSTSVNSGDANWVALNSGAAFTLPVNGGGTYLNTTSPLEVSPDFGSDISYDTLVSLGIPTGTQSLLFNFQKFGGTSGYAPEIIEIEGYSSVPEPSTWALMLGGLGLLFVLKRARHNQA